MIVAFKFSQINGKSFYNPNSTPKFRHCIGACLTVDYPNYDMQRECGAGVNLGSASWIVENRHVNDNNRRSLKSITIWVVTRKIRHTAAVPFQNDGKYCTRYGKVRMNISLACLKRMVKDGNYIPKVIRKIMARG